MGNRDGVDAPCGYAINSIGICHLKGFLNTTFPLEAQDPVSHSVTQRSDKSCKIETLCMACRA